ncbi:DsbC family protein [Novosphingobium sp. ST904]|uniref:DsbC family protein n=1 Tax=Novosphingobium sp. ST904 TaxID=1684385 RepID=UPI001042A2D0|nr:DsbC family protein [Novosphingobium sp. ST904]TCM32330.1 thiol:disulfide interchange protein DsbC [Novosphingobium sp. ST904]
MSATDQHDAAEATVASETGSLQVQRKWNTRLRARLPLYCALAGFVGLGAVAGASYASDFISPSGKKVEELLKARLPKTKVTSVNCDKVDGLCEVTAGSNLFYIDRSARYLVIGRVYDMETRQDLTATRLLEMNPDMLLGGSARANAAGAEAGDGETAAFTPKQAALPKGGAGAPAQKVSLAGLPRDGAIVWGKPSGKTVTVFSDFRCGYCRALSNTLAAMNVRVIERPISVFGSRDLANQVYCAKNREKALHDVYAGRTLTGGGSCDTKGLDANEAFARQHGFSGTPVIVREDGAVIEGYRPREFLESWIAGGKA